MRTSSRSKVLTRLIEIVVVLCADEVKRNGNINLITTRRVGRSRLLATSLTAACELLGPRIPLTMDSSGFIIGGTRKFHWGKAAVA